MCQPSSAASAQRGSPRRPPAARLRRDDVVVAAFASRRGARGYADHFAIERAYDSYEELLADPDLERV